MNATGKKARRESGLTRHELHKAHHSRKRPAKIKRFNLAKKEAKAGK
jgi:hypothetical protein